MEIAQAAASTSDEKLLFSKKACLPFHLIVMSLFKERARLGQHCPVSIYSEFKGRVSRAAYSNPSVYLLYILTLVWFFSLTGIIFHTCDCIQALLIILHHLHFYKINHNVFYWDFIWQTCSRLLIKMEENKCIFFRMFLLNSVKYKRHPILSRQYFKEPCFCCIFFLFFALHTLFLFYFFAHSSLQNMFVLSPIG